MVLISTGVLHFHISEGLQGVLIADTGHLQRTDHVIHLFGLGNKLFSKLLDPVGSEVPEQTVVITDPVPRAKHNFTWTFKNNDAYTEYYNSINLNVIYIWNLFLDAYHLLFVKQHLVIQCIHNEPWYIKVCRLLWIANFHF